MNLYAEEVKGLKEKIKDLQKTQQQEAKTAQKQQEYLIGLEQKYREVCEKAGISASHNATRAEEINKTRQLQKLTGLQQQSPNNRTSSTNLRKAVPKAQYGKMRVEGADDEGEEDKLEVIEAIKNAME